MHINWKTDGTYTYDWEKQQKEFERELDSINRLFFGHGHKEYVFTKNKDTESFSCVVEMPGVKKEDVIVDTTDKSVFLSWKDRHGVSQSAKLVDKRVDFGKLEASLVDGLLTLTAPPVESELPTRVVVK